MGQSKLSLRMATISGPPADSAASIQHDEGVIAPGASPRKGPALYFYVTLPAGTPRAAVGILHGYADHGARYARVADAWAARGIACVAIDLRGHGRAEGRRGYCERFSQFLDDTSEISRLLGQRAPAAPRFLFGHSFGGLVAATAALADPSAWRGLVLSAPYFGTALKVPLFKRLAGPIASRFWPTLSLASGLRGEDMTHDKALAELFDSDPLSFSTANARWFIEAQAAQTRALARASSLEMPLYVFAGTQDRVSDVASMRRFFDAAGSPDKTFDTYEGAFHEVLSEPEWRVAADKVADWILARLG